MSINTNGFEYEQTVLDSIAAAGITGNIKEAAGASSAHGDADFKIGRKVHLVEVKLDKNAQMGGSSVRYTFGGAELGLLSPVEPEIHKLVVRAVKDRTTELDELLRYLAKKWNSDILGFPVRCSKQVWTEAASDGLLVNAKIRTDVKFIAQHYRSKGVNYMQIGKSGLFYLDKNPAGLPIPKLEGEINLEIRTARSGSQKLKSGIRAVTGAIRVQGRLKTKNKSPFSLDDPSSIKAMLKSKR